MCNHFKGLRFADEPCGLPMNKFPHSLSTSRPIDIGAEPDFSLGDLSVRPSLRKVGFGDRHETVEPRVMQVLVALVRVEGSVVSRDRLIEQCWGGRLVGDDAINSCIAKVRALATLTAVQAFDIETIPRVGYRLHAREAKDKPVLVAGDTSPPEIRSLTWRTGVPIAAALAIVTAAAFFFVSRPREWVVAETRQPFISTPLIERHPAISPDGTMIAYSAGSDFDSRKLYLRLIKGGDPIALATDAGDAVSPAWSPDGRTLAYVLYKANQPCRIMLAPVPAGPSRQVGRCRTVERSSVTWDRDSHALFFADSPVTGEPTRIVRLDLDTGHTVDVTNPSRRAAQDYSPTVSPDGKTLLYGRALGGLQSELRLHSLSDGSERLVIRSADSENNGAWSADSLTIFVSRSSTFDASLWGYPANGGAPSRITSSLMYIGRIASGPNGLLALETAYLHGLLVVAAPANGNEAPKPFNHAGTNIGFADYAPDGTLAVIAQHSGETGIYISGRDGSFHELAPLSKGSEAGLRWSPDSTHLAYIVPAGDGFDVPVLDRSGAIVTRLHYAAQESGRFEWSEDGTKLFISKEDAHGWREWRVDLAPPHKTVAASSYGWIGVRPWHGMMFAMKDGGPGVWRIDGVPRRVADGPDAGAFESWTLAAGCIVYPDYSDASHPVFVSVPTAGGPKTILAAAQGVNLSTIFTVDPKTGQVVYSLVDQSNADIALLRLIQK
jgi:Tol biopolymer transport system component/DNA-binding winged helix-turn-helix (wHTH) protein